MARYSPFPTNLDPVRKLPVKTAVTVMVTVVFFKCLFSCPCARPEDTTLHCWLYLLLPVGIMFFILSLVDSQLLKLCQCYVCRCCARAESRCCLSGCCDSVECCCCAGGYCYRPTHCGEEVRYYCALIGTYMLRVFCASALWVVVALIDADWYVCIRTVTVNGTGPQQIACKDVPTPEEAETLRKYSSESRVGLRHPFNCQTNSTDPTIHIYFINMSKIYAVILSCLCIAPIELYYSNRTYF